MAMMYMMKDPTTGRQGLSVGPGGLTVEAGEAIPANSFVYLKEDSGDFKAFVAKAAAYASRAVAFCPAAIAVSASGPVMFDGVVSGVTMTPGTDVSAAGDIYLGLAGERLAAPDAATTTGNIIQKVGVQVDTDAFALAIADEPEEMM